MIIIPLVTLLFWSIFLNNRSVSQSVHAAVVKDDILGSYTDDFGNTTGISSKSNADVDTGSSSVELTPLNTPPYPASGYVITNTITPSRWTAWDEIQVHATKPLGTTVKVQLLTSTNKLIPDTFLPGNSTGITAETIDLSAVPYWATPSSTTGLEYGNILAMRIKITLETIDSNVTPQVHDVSMTWLPPQGGLSIGSMADTAQPIAASYAKTDGSKKTPGEVSAPVVYQWARHYPSSINPSRAALAPNGMLIMKTHGSDYPGSYAHFLGIDPATGDINWDTVYTTWMGSNATKFSISDTGIIVFQDFTNDVNMAFDSNDGSFLWSIQYGRGHPNDPPMIGRTGLTFYHPGYGVILARDANGTNMWQKTIYSTSYTATVHMRTTDSSDLLYLALSTTTGEGRILAVDQETGADAWSYAPAGLNYLTLIIDDAENLYAIAYDATMQYYVISLDGSGNFRWQYTIPGKSDYTTYFTPQLTGSGTLFVGYSFLPEWDVLHLSFLDTETGELSYNSDLYPIPGSTAIATGNYYSDAFLDADADLILPISFYYGPDQVFVENRYSAYDPEGNHLWSIRNTNPSISPAPHILDAQDRLYEITDDDPGTDNASILSMLKKWTIEVSTDKADYRPGETVTFTVDTSMNIPNPHTGEEGQIQIFLTHGRKISLIKTSTRADGSVWSGTYEIPQNADVSAYPQSIPYTAEGVYPGILTNTTVHFDAPATLSENTGVTAAGSFTVSLTVPDQEENGTNGGLVKTGAETDISFCVGIFLIIVLPLTLHRRRSSCIMILS